MKNSQNPLTRSFREIFALWVNRQMEMKCILYVNDQRAPYKLKNTRKAGSRISAPNCNLKVATIWGCKSMRTLRQRGQAQKAPPLLLATKTQPSKLNMVNENVLEPHRWWACGAQLMAFKKPERAPCWWVTEWVWRNLLLFDSMSPFWQPEVGSPDCDALEERRLELRKNWQWTKSCPPRNLLFDLRLEGDCMLPCWCRHGFNSAKHTTTRLTAPEGPKMCQISLCGKSMWSSFVEGREEIQSIPLQTTKFVQAEELVYKRVGKEGHLSLTTCSRNCGVWKAWFGPLTLVQKRKSGRLCDLI